MKIKKKYFLGGRGGWVGGGGGRQVGEVRVDVKEELKFLGKFTKTNFGGRGQVGGVGFLTEPGFEPMTSGLEIH